MELEQPIKETYTQVEKIGEGSFGHVYKAIHNQSKAIVAIKKVKIEHISDGIPQTTLREISILKELHHQNIVKLKDVVN